MVMKGCESVPISYVNRFMIIYRMQVNKLKIKSCILFV
jgi:hypothetical protein